MKGKQSIFTLQNHTTIKKWKIRAEYMNDIKIKYEQKMNKEEKDILVHFER